MTRFSTTRSLLEGTPLTDFCSQLRLAEYFSGDLAFLTSKKPDKLVTVRSDATLANALQILAEHGVLSLPVINATNGDYSGFIDVLDILNALLAIDFNGAEGGLDDLHSKAPVALEDASYVVKDNANQPISAHLHEEDIWFKGDLRATLMEVIREGFRAHPQDADGAAARHRVAIFQVDNNAPDASWQLNSIVSQSDVMRFLWQNVRAGNIDLSCPLADTGLLEARPVARVHVGSSLISAFAALRKSKMSGLAIVDDAGVLVGNLSATDLRSVALDPNHLCALGLPVGEFLALQAGNAGYTWADLQAGRVEVFDRASPNWEALLPAPVTVAPSATLADAVAALVKNGVHRVYVEGDSGRPSAVVTPTDVLGVIVQEPAE